jgi:competence protein ComEA
MSLVPGWRSYSALLFCVTAIAQTKLPEGEGRAAVERVCSKCHKLEQIVREGRTEESWGEVIETMVARGAQGTEQELEQVFQYLAKNFPKQVKGKISVNKAAAAEISAALGLSAAEGEAIVSFREKQGAFKSVEELKKVPGVDAARIDERRESLEF